MAATFDLWFEDGSAASSSPLTVASNTAGFGSGTSVAATAGRVAIVFVQASTGGLVTIGVTFNGNAMTQIGTTLQTAGTRAVAMFGIKTDASIASGTATVVATFTPTGGTLFVSTYVFNGCDTTTGWNGNVSNTGNSTSASSGAITSTTNDYCVGGIADDNANGTGAGGTSGTTMDRRDGRFDGNYIICREAGASSVTMDVTIGSVGTPWAMLAVNIVGAAAGGSGSPSTASLTMMGVQ